MTDSAAAPLQRRWSLAHLVLAIPWIAVVIASWTPIRDNSFLWHVRAGSLQADSGLVLTEDPFSFTMAGEPWLTQSWLAELFYAWAEGLWGLGFVPPMLMVLNSLVIGGIGLVTYRYSRSVLATAFLTMLSTILLISFMVPRPVIFSYALFVAVILAWDRPQTRWVVPFLFWIWAALHGSFAIGLAYVGLRWLMDREWKWWGVGLASGLATLMTAHGTGVVLILLAFSSARDVLPLLVEWRQPELISATFTPFLVGVIIVVVGAFRGLISHRHALLVAPVLLLGLSAVRSVPPAWFALLPLMALSLSGIPKGTTRRFSRVPVAVFLVAVLAIPLAVRSDGALDEERFPVDAVAALHDVRTIHDDRTGGYLIYLDTLSDGVFIDDRAELYKDRIAEFVEIRDGTRAWEPIFARDGVQQALFSVDEPLVDGLTGAGWLAVYRDERFVVLRPAA